MGFISKRKFWKRFERIVSATLLVIFGLVILLFFLIQTPPVQNIARKKLVNYLERKLETKIQVGHLKLGFDRLALRDLYLEDRNGDTLLAGGDAVFRLNVLGLLLSNDLDIESIRLNDFTANVHRKQPGTTYNFQFIIDAFTRPEGRARDTGTVTYAIPHVEFNRMRFKYEDVVAGIDTRGYLEQLTTRIDTLDGEHLVFDFPSFELNGLTASVRQYKPIDLGDSGNVDTVNLAMVPDIALGTVMLKDIHIDFQNQVSSFFSNVRIGELSLEGEQFDLANRSVALDAFALSNSDISIRVGDAQQAAAIKEEVKEGARELSGEGWRIQVGDLDLRNNRIRFDNDQKPAQRIGVDYAHLDARDLNLQVEDFVMAPDSIGGRIIDASFREKSGFHLQTLRANALYSARTIYLDDLYLKTPGSELKRFARLDYNSLRELSRNFPATRMDIDIADSYVKVGDILAFAPALARHSAFSNAADTWNINLQGSGTLRSFHIGDLQFDGLKNTRLDLDGSLAIHPDAGQSGGTLNIRQLHSSRSDLALFTGNAGEIKGINIPETFSISGVLKGGVNGIDADLAVNTTLGDLQVDGNIQRPGSPTAASYAARVQTRNLQLGRLIGDPAFGILSADLDLEGRGLQAGSFDTDFSGVIHQAGYNDYTYSNINLTGSIHGSALRVDATVRDPNASLSGELVAELTGNPSFRFSGFIDSLKLEPLHLARRPMVVRGRVEADVPVISEETLEANILVTDALLVAASQRLQLDTVSFIAGRNDSVQYMRLESEVARASLQGRFRFGDLGKMFSDAIQPYFAVETAPRLSHPYAVSFSADIINAPILAELVPGLNSLDPLQMEGTLTSSEGLNARVTTTHIDYKGNLLQGLNLDITTTPAGLSFTADVSRLKNNAFDIHHTRLSGLARDNQLDFRLAMDDAQNRRRYFLSGLLQQPRRGSFVLNLRPDSLLLDYQPWNISPNNSLSFTGDELRANDFTLSRGPEILSLQSNGEILNATFTNFQLSTITGFLKSDSLLANGRMSGTVSFRNILRQPVFTSDLDIADLSIRGDTLGNAAIKVSTAGANRYNANATITGRGNDVQLTGSFSPSGQRDIALNLDLAIRQLQLSTVDGALGGFIKNSSGAVSGNVSIRGSLADPQISGPLRFDDASFALTVLGSQFKVDGEELLVSENGFRFNDFVIRDSANQTMVLNGVVSTDNFSAYRFDLSLDADQFQILNTTKKESRLYYGSLVISADLEITGDTDQPVVDGAIIVNDGTELTLVIPQREPGIISREGIVDFVNLDQPEMDTLFRSYDSLNVASFRGMNIAANIEIRREAVFNVVVDEANGDFLNVQGEALITTGIDPSGKITMVGSYELERGAYEISFNLIRRRFEIEKGSRIQWFNEPTRAVLDVKAVYVANTSPIELVQQQVQAATPAIRNTYLQRLPFEVQLHMTGELLQPDVAFDIVLPSNRSYGVSNDIITQVESRLAQVRADPGETNKQVFALLLLNRFVGENPLESSQEMFSGSRYVRQSVSRLLTEQLNQLAAGLIDGVDLRFDVVSAEDYTTGDRRSRTDLSIGLSKQLLSERLTVSVGRNVELEGDRPVQPGANSSSGALGNLSVEYALTRDRRYLIRFYRQNEYQGVLDGYVVESGLSFMISVDYERFRELITRRKKQKVEGVE